MVCPHAHSGHPARRRQGPRRSSRRRSPRRRSSSTSASPATASSSSADHAAVIALPGVANPDDETPRGRPRRARCWARRCGSGLPVLGICLGAELLAEAAGGRHASVHRRSGATARSRLPPAAAEDALLGDLPARFERLPGARLRLRPAAGRRRARRLARRAAGVPRRRRARGACSSIPSRRSRCSTAGRARSATSCRRTASTPRRTRALGRRHVPEWSERAAVHGAALRRGRARAATLPSATARAARRGEQGDRLDVVVQQVLEHDRGRCRRRGRRAGARRASSSVPVTPTSANSASSDSRPSRARRRGARHALQVGGVDAGQPRHHHRERQRRRVAARVPPRALDHGAPLGALGRRREDGVVLVGELRGEARGARLRGAADDDRRVRPLHRLRAARRRAASR